MKVKQDVEAFNTYFKNYDEEKAKQRLKAATTIQNYLNRTYPKDIYELQLERIFEEGHYKLYVGDFKIDEVNNVFPAYEDFLDGLSDFMWELKLDDTYPDFIIEWTDDLDEENYIRVSIEDFDI